MKYLFILSFVILSFAPGMAQMPTPQPSPEPSPEPTPMPSTIPSNIPTPTPSSIPTTRPSGPSQRPTGPTRTPTLAPVHPLWCFDENGFALPWKAGVKGQNCTYAPTAAPTPELLTAKCWGGSNLYQKQIQDCNKFDPLYNGTWYCTKVEVCEAYISDQRSCMVTRGCAKEEECIDPVATEKAGYMMPYDGKNKILFEGIGPNKVLPAGMTIRVSCCETFQLFPWDDSKTISKYSLICNSANRKTFGILMILVIFFLSIFLSVR